MCQDHHNVPKQSEDNAHSQPLKEQLPRLAEVQGRVSRGLLGGVGVVWQRLSPGPQLRGLGWGVIIIMGSGDAVDGERNEVDKEED